MIQVKYLRFILPNIRKNVYSSQFSIYQFHPIVIGMNLKKNSLERKKCTDQITIL